jgi:hypothetical protein
LSSDIILSCWTAIDRHRRSTLLLRPWYCVALALREFVSIAASLRLSLRRMDVQMMRRGIAIVNEMEF